MYTALHNTMKKYIIASFIVYFSSFCSAGEWFIVGSGKAEAEVNTEIVEAKLWEFLAAKSKEQFRPKESYRFQYKFVSKNEIYINALCGSASKGTNDVGVMPDFTSEQLTKDFINVFDGGSCYFGVKFNTEKHTFSKLLVNGRA